MEKKYKWIKVKDETHQKLLRLGRKGETFDQIIGRLLDAYAEEVKSHE